MSKPKTITIDNTKYYNTVELEIYDPVFFVGCKKTVRKLIDIKNISESNIAYGNNNKRYGWRLSKNQTNPPPKALLLLKENWVLKNMPKMNKESEKEESETEEPKNEEKNNAKNKFPKVPDLLILNEEEKFHDDEGNVFEIETVGKRTSDGVYFLAEDVSRVFEMNKIERSVINRKSSELNSESLTSM